MTDGPYFADRRTGDDRRSNWASAIEARGAYWAKRQILDDLDKLLERWQLEGHCPNEEIQAVVAKYRQ